jgi:VanZ family protein
MGYVWFIPPSVAQWADKQENDTIRTAVPLVALGLVVGGQLAWQRRPWWQWLVAWGLLLVLVVLAEAGQHFRAYRSFDLADIAWGAIGAAIGLALVAVLSVGYWLLRRGSSSRQAA